MIEILRSFPFFDFAMNSISRRQMLRAAGVSLALPTLASLQSASAAEASSPKRMVCIGNMLGFVPGAFWPTLTNTTKSTIETDYEFGRAAKSLQPWRDQLTLISGLDHDLRGGHFSIHAFLSGVRQIDAKSMPSGNITIDQFAAETIGGKTRFPSLTIGSEDGIHGGCQLSWTRSGSRVPPIAGPRELFDQLFVGTAQTDRENAARRLELRKSILDAVHGDAKSLATKLNSTDRNKLDEYLSSVRDVEVRIEQRKRWLDIPKPKPPIERPTNSNMVEDLPLLYDLIALALQTDSTRITTLEIGGDFNPRDLGVSGGYHSLSHHGKVAAKIESLVKIESYQIEQFARFLKKLASISEQGSNLLNEAMVLFGSGMGDANSHTNSNLPVVLAGGGYRHGRHLAFGRKAADRPPLCNLFVSMLQNFGVETDTFAHGSGTLRGLA